eukprot:6398944-Lingulodinium_polyedra.AAC.1
MPELDISRDDSRVNGVIVAQLSSAFGALGQCQEAHRAHFERRAISARLSGIDHRSEGVIGHRSVSAFCSSAEPRFSVASR